MIFEDFKLKVIICTKCNKKMIDGNFYELYNCFPTCRKYNLWTQLSRKNMTIRSKTKEGYSYLCKNCEDEMEFKCFGCKEIRLKKDIKYKHGDPSDFLCKQCYRSKTAKEWNKFKDEIEENHRWNYE